MYIPVSLTTGPTHVDITIDVDGAFIADCDVTYKGQSYQPSTVLQVARTDTVRLSTVVTGYREISVTLNGKQYYWFVDVDKDLRYVDSDAYKTVSGSVYGKVLNVSSGVELSYTPTAEFSGGSSVAVIDKSKNDVWFFNTLNQVKKLNFPEAVIAVVFLPNWAQMDDIATTCYVVCHSHIHKLNATFDVAETYAVIPGIVAASGDAQGMIVLAYANILYRWQNGSNYGAIENTNLVGIHSIFVAPDNTYYVGTSAIVSVKFAVNSTSYTHDVILFTKGKYASFGINETHLYAVDPYNRSLVRISLADKSNEFTYFDKVPRDVVVNGDEIFVSFLDDANVVKLNTDFSTRETIPARRSAGATYLNGYWITDLYSDAANKTLPEPAVDGLIDLRDTLPINKPYTATFTVDWPRPEFVRVGSSATQVTVNGVTFTEGYLRNGDLVAVAMSANANYYDETQVPLIGRRVHSFRLRTEPKLFPDFVTLDSVLQALPRVEYDELFEVQGMTWGFDVGVSTDSADITFAVNDEALGKQSRIKNGDVVSVKGAIKNLIAQRTAHVIKTEHDVPVAEWTLLPMLLEGTTRRVESTQKKDRFGHLFESNVASKTSAQPKVMPKISNFASDTSADYGPKSVVSSVNVNGECAASLPCFTVDNTSYLSGPQQIAFFNEGGIAVKGPVDVAYASENETFRAPAATSNHIDGMDALNLQQVSVFQNTDFGISLQNTTESVDASYRKNVLGVFNTSREVQMLYAFKVDYTVRNIEPAFDVGYTYSFATQNPDVKCAHYFGKHFVVAEIERSVMFNRTLFEVDVDVRQLRPTHEFQSDADTFWHYPVNEFAAAAERRLLQNRYRVDTDAKLRSTNVPSEFGADAEQRSLGVFSEFSVSVVLRPSVSPYSTYVSYERKPSANRPSSQLQAVRATRSSVLIRASAPVFVHSRHSELQTQDSGFFDTLEDAQTYAATLNLEENTPAQFRQYGNKWVLISTPVAENAACFPVPSLPSERRKFGYVGGG